MKVKRILWSVGSIICLLVLWAGGVIDLNALYDYEGERIPSYIVHHNIPQHNPITNRGATLGRVLFYDKRLSLNKRIACASCHKQEFSFGDTFRISGGAFGPPLRHTMRIAYAGFKAEPHAFWDERAKSLEDQATVPIKDHLEMGFSGQYGRPGMDSLLRRMRQIEYYPVLFEFAFGDTAITEERIQLALAQFVRSIYAFDSKYDSGRAMVQSDTVDFPNFTEMENHGKRLFMTLPKDGGAGCFRCHVPPEFGIDPQSKNNGIVGVIHGGHSIDTSVTNAPSLRNLFDRDGIELGPFMHDFSLKTLYDVMLHYEEVASKPPVPNLDERLQGSENEIRLSEYDRVSIISFLNTLVSPTIFTAEKWSNPFDENDTLEIVPLVTAVAGPNEDDHSPFVLRPNPCLDVLELGMDRSWKVMVFDRRGYKVREWKGQGRVRVEVQDLPRGLYFVRIVVEGEEAIVRRMIKL